MESFSTCPFFWPGFFHSASMLLCVSVAHFLLLLDSIALYACAVIWVSIHLLMNIPPPQVLTITKKVAMNIHVQLFVWTYISFSLR